MKRALFFVLVVLVACGPPPPPPPKTPQELLVDRVASEAVEGAGTVGDGAKVRVGKLQLHVEHVDREAKPRDHTREVVTAAMALGASTGVSELKKANEAVTGVFELADKLGKIFGKNEEKAAFVARAEVEDRSWAVSCSTSTEQRGIDERARPSLTCAIARGAATPEHVWKLDLKTVGGKSQALSFPVSLTRAPAGESFWMNRPEKRSLVQGGDDYSAFIVGKDSGGGPNLGRLVVSPKRLAYLDAETIEPESRDALRIAFALLSLVDWAATDVSAEP